MTALERRASFSLALIFALRMLGLFLVLPVFALEAQQYPGGDNPSLVGLAMGAYGLTQAVLQLPLGLASDRWGRKRVIVAGLLVFAAGSVLAALAQSVMGLLAGRALQGAGAVSAATVALLADQTRDNVRTKAMALIGASIGLMFAVALIAAPLLAASIGLSGIFVLTSVLALAGMATVIWLVPPETAAMTTGLSASLAVHGEVKRGSCYVEPKAPLTGGGEAPAERSEFFTSSQAMPLKQSLAGLWQQADLLRLNMGVFILHTVQMAMWVVVPAMLVQAGLPQGAHWQTYLPAVLLSFAAMGGLFALERRGHLRAALLFAIALVLCVQVALGLLSWSAISPSLPLLGVLLFVFFCGFNVLEALQPSLVSRMAPPTLRGAALGAYNTLQSLGLFAGGALGGCLMTWAGAAGLFAATALLTALWLGHAVGGAFLRQR